MNSTHFRHVVLMCFLLLSPATGRAMSEEAPVAERPGAIWAASPLEIVFSDSNADVERVAKNPPGKPILCYDGKVVAIPTSRRLLGSLSIGGERLTDGGRTLTLATDPHSIDGEYVVFISPTRIATYNLGGVETAWFAGEDPGDEPTWKGWQPTLDPVGSQRATLGSAPHERWFADLSKPGRLRLETQVRPPAGQGRLTIESSALVLECFSGEGEPEKGIEETESGGSRVSFSIADASAPLFLSLTVETGKARPLPTIHARFSADGDGAAQELDRDQLLLPWASPIPAPSQKSEMAIPDLTGGNPKRGKEIYFGDEALCSRCHVFAGEGTTVGPDLTDIRSKSAEDVYRSIAAPSEEIALEYISQTVALKDGRVAVGIVRAEGFDAIRVTDSEAKSVTFPRDEIDQIRPAATSIMPVGLAPALGEEKLRDLIAFLTTPPFDPTTGERTRYEE